MSVFFLLEPLPSVEISPGSSIVLTGAVQGKGVLKVGAGHGTFSMLTVDISRMTRMRYIENFFLRPDGSQYESDPYHQMADGAEGNTAEAMHQAEATANTIAWEVRNKRMVSPSGVLIDTVGCPLLGLAPGDIVLRAGGEVVRSPDELIARINGAGGMRHALLLEGHFGRRTQLVITAKNAGEFGWGCNSHAARLARGAVSALGLDSGEPLVGEGWFLPVGNLTAPVGDIHGPSAGLMLTLSFIDATNRGDLPGGKHIAGTGTISASGSVGAIGGMPQKVETAIAAGNTVMLVPAGQAQEAAKAARGRIRIVGVSSLSGAVSWLCEHGGNGRVCSYFGNVSAR